MPVLSARRTRAGLGLARRLVALSLPYRRACALVFAFQIVLLGLGVSGLGLSADLYREFASTVDLEASTFG
jgi:hypothetical protein